MARPWWPLHSPGGFRRTVAGFGLIWWDFGEALDVSWGGYEGNVVTPPSYVLGNLKKWYI
ncbi:hypothetical protein DVH24_014478 [Malus domestica]|uniref:Uncharacterized protein n=1 Tax=Malus domestica TaxID=3750 RepID=A0A498KQ84_MALDO|nr:hypothetical protein DVH24_014478 [Malus domestica]